MHLAWSRRRELVSTLSLILVPGLILILITRLLAAGSNATVINGYFLLPTPLYRTPSWIEGAIFCLTWAWAVSAGTLVVMGVLRGKDISPIAAARRAVRAILGIGFVAYNAAWGLQILGEYDVPVPALVVIWIVAIIIICRLLLGIPVKALGLDQTLEFSSGRVTQTVLTVGGGVVAPGAAVYWLASPVQEWLSEGWLPGVTASIAAGLLLVVTALALTAVQAATLGSLCLDLMEDTEFTDAQLTKLAAPPVPARWRAAAVIGLAIPAVLIAGVAVANPFDRPEIRANEMRVDEVYGAGWPAGQHPIILTTNGFLDCQDDECRTFHKREFRTSQRPAGLNPLMVGTSAVTPAGVVLRALAEQSGQIALQRCTRTGTCQTGTATMPAFQGQVKLAIAEGADGAIYVATAHDLSQGKFEQALTRCADISCADAKRHDAGTYDGDTEDLAGIHLGLTPEDKAQAIFGRGSYGEVATCDSVSCGKLELSDSSVGRPLAAAVQDPRADSVRLMNGTLMYDCQGRGCDILPHTFDIDCCLHGQYKPLALAVFGNVISAVIVQPAGSTRGTQRQTVLWQCLDVSCDHERKLPLQITPSTPDSVFLTANPDGRLLIVQSGEQDFVYTVAAA